MGEILLGKGVDTGEKIVLPQIDRFAHMIILGPTRCGKTSKVIIPSIWQDLVDIKIKRIKYESLKREIMNKSVNKMNRARARINKDKSLSYEQKIEAITKAVDQIKKKRDDSLSKINPQQYIAGLTVVEPKGDLAEEVVKMCKVLGLPYKYLNPLDENTHRMNIMYGDSDIVAESNRTVLRNLFGQQEPFFAQVQETTARNTMLLLKKLRGNDIDIREVGRALRDSKILKSYLEDYEKKYPAPNPNNPDDLIEFFRSEVFGTLKDKFYQFAMGLRQQIEDLSQNTYLQRVLIGENDIDLDKHLAEGGILIVNTCMGILGRLGDIFGQFVIMHFQNAVFRRQGNERDRTYHYLYIDEAPRYLNPDFERLLAIGGSYRCSVNLAIQSVDQLKLESKREFAGIVLANCRNKVLFGGLTSTDAKLFEAEFGADTKLVSEYQYGYGKLIPLPSLIPKGYKKKEQLKNRFDYTAIIELKSEQLKAEALVRYYKNGAIQFPCKIVTKVVRFKKPLRLRLVEFKYQGNVRQRYKDSINRVAGTITRAIAELWEMLKRKCESTNKPQPTAPLVEQPEKVVQQPYKFTDTIPQPDDTTKTTEQPTKIVQQPVSSKTEVTDELEDDGFIG